MATITLTLSARTSKDTGKAEILLRYRNTREVALRAHTRVEKPCVRDPRSPSAVDPRKQV